jgi:hypothetical protein
MAVNSRPKGFEKLWRLAEGVCVCCDDDDAVCRATALDDDERMMKDGCVTNLIGMVACQNPWVGGVWVGWASMETSPWQLAAGS